MATLRSPTGSTIQATGRLQQRLLDAGWTVSDDPAAPGQRMVTAADLDNLAGTLSTAVAASVADRADLRSIVEPMAVEVDELGQTIEAVTTQAAPKPTPRMDALETWRAQAEQAISQIQATVAAIDVPAQVDAWLQAHPAPAGADGKSAYQLARDGGYGGTQTQWLASLVGAQGVKGDKGDQGIQGLPGLAGVTDYNLLLNKPTLGTAASRDVGTGAAQVVLGNDARLSDARTPTAHTQAASTITGLHQVATTGAYSDLSGTPTIPAAVNARQAIVNTAALTANTVKNVTVSWPSAMPNATYAVTALVEHATAPQQFAISLVSRTTTGCVLAVRSTAAVNAQGLNVHCIALS